MQTFGRLSWLAVGILLLGSAVHAQDAAPVSDATSEQPSSEFHALSARIDALEAENRLLRREVFRDSDAEVALAGFTTACDQAADPSCGPEADSPCGWIDQLSASCKEKLSWNKGPLRITPYGYVAGDMIASEKAYAILGGPLFLLPAVPANVPDARFTFSGQQTTLGFNISGPEFCGYQSGANIAFNFFGDRPVQNNPGVFFLIGYVELKNERWRFWAGQHPDVIGQQVTNSPAWTSHKQSGEFGQIRPGFRAQRFFELSDTAAMSLYAGLTQQVVLDFIADPTVAGTDNGWPNVEMRWELGLGSTCNDTRPRPFTFALGGLIGETRAVDFFGNALANVSTTWAVVPELRIQHGRWGFQGEAFVGDALGTYNAAIGQSLNATTDEAVYTAGGFGELFYQLKPKFTVSVGYGIDNPRDADLAADQRSRNETYWTNFIWRCSEQLETRFEVARMETDYIAPSVSSRAMQYITSIRYYF